MDGRSTTSRQLVTAVLALACAALAVTALTLFVQQAAQASPRPELFALAAITLACASAVLFWDARQKPRREVPAALIEEFLHFEQRAAARLAGQLHDTAVQSLVVAAHMSRAEDEPSGGRAVLTDQLLTAERELRDAILGARPPVLVEEGLGQACGHLNRLLDLRDGLAITWDWSAHPALTIPEVTADFVYRFLLETLSNAAEHSGRSTAHVTLMVRGAELIVSVQDDGCGFPESSRTPAVSPNFTSGLGMLYARAALLGDRLSVTTGPNHGTTVTLRCEMPTDLEHTMVRIGSSPAS